MRDQQAILWNNGSRYRIPGAFVDETVCPVVPPGSTWARNPVPRINTDNIGLAYVGNCTQGPPRREDWSAAKEDCQQFASPCPFDQDWFECTNGTDVTQGGCDNVGGNNDHWGMCSGDWTLGMVEDRVQIPKSLNPGKYVVSWRMDCEETAQIWSNWCAGMHPLERPTHSHDCLPTLPSLLLRGFSLLAVRMSRSSPREQALLLVPPPSLTGSHADKNTP